MGSTTSEKGTASPAKVPGIRNKDAQAAPAGQMEQLTASHQQLTGAHTPTPAGRGGAASSSPGSQRREEC